MKTSSKMITRILTSTLVLIFLFGQFSSITYAQNTKDFVIPKSINIVESNFELEGVQRNGFEVIMNGDDAGIIKMFKEKLKETYNLKASSKGGMLIAEDQFNTALSDKHFGLFVLVKTDGEGNHLRVWMNFGKDIYVSSSTYSPEALKLKAFIRGFVVDYYNSFIQDAVDDKTKEVASLGKELEKDKKALAKEKKNTSKLEAKASKSLQKQKKLEQKKADLESSIASAQQDHEQYANEAEKSKVDIESKKLEVEQKGKLYTEKNGQLSTLKLKMEELKSLK